MDNNFDVIYNKHLEEIREMLKEKGVCLSDKPTGYGKTYGSFEIMKDYKNVFYLYPTTSIKVDTSYKYNDKIYNIENYQYISYRKLLNMFKGNSICTYFVQYDNTDTLFILDECHTACALKTKFAIQYLMWNCCPNAHFLGLTGTSVRTDKIDVRDELFEENATDTYTLGDAIRDGLFPPPHYIKGTFNLDETLSNFYKRIEKIDNNKNHHVVESLTKKLLKMSKLNIDHVLEKWLYKLLGKDVDYMKIMVFFPDKKYLEEKTDYYEAVFKKLYPNHEINMVKIYSDSRYRKNVNLLPNLKYEGTKKIDIIVSINMLNMGYHVDDLHAVILNRPTSSDIIYKQQCGRVFKRGAKINPIIFDFVGNWKKDKFLQNHRI